MGSSIWERMQKFSDCLRLLVKRGRLYKSELDEKDSRNTISYTVPHP